MNSFAVVLAVSATACLEPRVDDRPGASAHLLPGSAIVPSVTSDTELTNQIALNDGIDDRTLTMANGVIPRGSGLSADRTVRYWSFGPATRAPSPIYQLYAPDGETPIVHPGLIDALPGDGGYSALHAINKVVTTAAYGGELITTVDALHDAIDLGLVEEPAPTGRFVVTPIVLPGTTLQVSDDKAVDPEAVYARGYQVATFRFGGELGTQPGLVLLPTSQVSFLREAHRPAYDANRPIFQATIPTLPADKAVTYTPLSVVINVDLAEGVTAASITKDADLFTRNAAGAITMSTASVAQFQITTTIQLLQLQFEEGRP